ncbi:hypothetical protein MH215_05335 [Paenibacillus sp. ACRSA]|uniref:hypothetical protein n=1 Tax=Paenibacillus sp. ACRSA TaxID=2918211 RepID=UPI001EF604AD|nr:hypothetical protein [Paenibacillus sp. ACRSA]MCG7376407.1 hypothetical protein [Paenibacillus sp. ACRSA]
MTIIFAISCRSDVRQSGDLGQHELNKAADKLINSKNMSALDSNWTSWKQQAKTNLNKTAGNITDVASDTLNRAKNGLPGSKLAMDGSPHVSFSKPSKPCRKIADSRTSGKRQRQVKEI